MHHLVYTARIARTYDQLLRHAFKRFSILRAIHTGIPTLSYYLRRPSLPISDKPALFTMNILPPMMTVWHHFVRKNVGDRVDTVIFDCSGSLNAAEFPGAWVQPFLNKYASVKSDEFLQSIARNRSVGWICDDDMFLLSPKAVDIVEREMKDANTACVSFRPRTWWEFDINGTRHPVCSSYCTAINRKILVDKEHLSLGPTGGNCHPGTGNKNPKRYDTFDKANEILLNKGYRCAVVSTPEQEECSTGFSGMSSAVMLLWYFKKPEDIIGYLSAPEKKQWSGTVLHDVFGGLLAIDAIQDLYETIKGERYPLRAMPSKKQLQTLRKEYEPLLGNGRSWRWVDTVAERLKREL